MRAGTTIRRVKSHSIGSSDFVACHVPSRPSIRSECRSAPAEHALLFSDAALPKRPAALRPARARSATQGDLEPALHAPCRAAALPGGKPTSAGSLAGGSARRGTRSSYHRMTRVLEGTVPRDPEAPTFLRYRF